MLGAVVMGAGVGCACRERVAITNQTAREVRVQVALPWPSYRLFYTARQFDTTIDPGMQWATSRADQLDRVDLHLKMANGGTIVRVKPNGLITQPWRAFGAGGDECVDAEVRADDAGQLQLWLRGADGRWSAAPELGVEFFRSHTD